MPKLSKSPPKYRRHKASGQAIVTLNGRDHYLGPYRSKASRAEYDRLIAEWLANGRQAPTSTSEQGMPRPTVSVLLAAYLRYAKTYYVADGKPTSEIACLKSVIASVRDLYAATPAAEFSPMALKAVRQKWVDAGLARTSCNARTMRVRRIFTWGVAEGIVPADVLVALKALAPLKRGRMTAKETPPVRPVPQHLVDVALPHLPPTLAAVVRLQLLTGARPGELLVMRACDLDTSDNVWVFRPATHKNSWRGQRREIYLGPPLALAGV